MACLLLIMMPLLLPLYAIRQTRMILRLVRLLRHPARMAQFGLAEDCVTGLCYWPGLMLLFALLLVCDVRSYDSDNPLWLMTFTPHGAAFALCSWVAMTLWFRSIVRRELAIYREPISLVPVVILTLICLTYSAGFVLIFWLLAGRGVLMAMNPIGDLAFGALALLFYIPFTSFISFVLVSIHVSQVRRAKTWETFIPPEEEEIP